MRRTAQAVAGFAAVFYLVLGVWAFAAPRSFFDNVGPYPPYNEHFLHDAGSFMLGLGAAALAALVVSDALVAVLTGIAVGSVVHEVAHIMDRLLGGHPSDPYTLGAVALVIVVGLVAAARRLGQARGPAAGGAGQDTALGKSSR
jgi:hypothetical protein